MTVYRSLIWNSWSWSHWDPWHYYNPITFLYPISFLLLIFLQSPILSFLPLCRGPCFLSHRESRRDHRGGSAGPTPCPAVALPSLLELQMNVWTSPRGYSFPCAADQLSSALPQDLPSVLPPPLLHLPLFLLSLISPHPNLPARGNAVFPPPHPRMQEQPTLCCDKAQQDQASVLVGLSLPLPLPSHAAAATLVSLLSLHLAWHTSTSGPLHFFFFFLPWPSLLQISRHLTLSPFEFFVPMCLVRCSLHLIKKPSPVIHYLFATSIFLFQICPLKYQIFVYCIIYIFYCLPSYSTRIQLLQGQDFVLNTYFPVLLDCPLWLH